MVAITRKHLGASELISLPEIFGSGMVVMHEDMKSGRLFSQRLVDFLLRSLEVDR
jgi:hypothetical protein